MKLFVLFLILTLYFVKQRVSVSLFCPINIIVLLGKTPLRENFISQGKKPVRGNPNFQHLGLGVFRGVENASFR